MKFHTKQAIVSDALLRLRLELGEGRPCPNAELIEQVTSALLGFIPNADGRTKAGKSKEKATADAMTFIQASKDALANN